MAANGNHATRATGPRCIALDGPFQSGKTTLLEAILARTGAVARQGGVEAGNTVGDASKEARDHRMSVELTVATTNFMGDPYTFLDCPGSVEFAHDMRAVLPAIDAAVVVCEMDEKKVAQLQSSCVSSRAKIPRLLFPTKSTRPMPACTTCSICCSLRTEILRQIPTFPARSSAASSISRSTRVYEEHALGSRCARRRRGRREKTARFSMLETLADATTTDGAVAGSIQPPRVRVSTI